MRVTFPFQHTPLAQMHGKCMLILHDIGNAYILKAASFMSLSSIRHADGRVHSFAHAICLYYVELFMDNPYRRIAVWYGVFRIDCNVDCRRIMCILYEKKSVVCVQHYWNTNLQASNVTLKVRKRNNFGRCRNIVICRVLLVGKSCMMSCIVNRFNVWSSFRSSITSFAQ